MDTLVGVAEQDARAHVVGAIGIVLAVIGSALMVYADESGGEELTPAVDTEKAGFVVEGRQRDRARVRDGYEDIVLMGILRNEWQS